MCVHRYIYLPSKFQNKIIFTLVLNKSYVHCDFSKWFIDYLNNAYEFKLNVLLCNLITRLLRMREKIVNTTARICSFPLEFSFVHETFRLSLCVCSKFLHLNNQVRICSMIFAMYRGLCNIVRVFHRWTYSHSPLFVEFI